MSVAPEAHEHLRENFWDFLMMNNQVYILHIMRYIQLYSFYFWLQFIFVTYNSCNYCSLKLKSFWLGEL